MIDVILDSLMDSVKLLPFLFVTYLAMEYLESRTGEKTKHFIRRAGHWGPLWGGILGIVPQCGFSAAASSLYAGRVITLGTLFAVFLSTSDEMLPIMISERTALPVLLKVLGLKVLIAMVAGFAVDAVYRAYRWRGRARRGGGAGAAGVSSGNESGREGTGAQAGVHSHSHADGHSHAAAEHSHADIHGHAGAHSHAHTHSHTHAAAPAMSEDEEEYQIGRLCEHEHCHCEDGSIVKSALKHTVNIFLFILLITFLLNAAFHFIGEENMMHWFGDRAVYGEAVASLLGLIPNCASSVLITQLYLNGIFGASQLIAGLLVNAGVGLLVLFRVNPDWKENVGITVLLYVLGVLGGLAVRALGIAF
ncbi:MAG: putative manganese transporter [Eubacteriales bacterium]|nr:putative manganese transporter [Eubacteriales bacterium]